MLNSPIKQIIPTEFILLTSGTYQQQNLHTWELNGNVGTVNSLANHVMSTLSTSITADLVGRAAPMMMGIGFEHQGAIPIASGWNNQRAVFIIRFAVEYQIGNIIDYIVQGYTDNPGYTATAVDENMVFYINNVMSFARTTIQHNGIAMQRTNMMADFQVINGYAGGSMGQPGGNILRRPIDCFSDISTRDLAGYARVTDATQLANVGVQTSRQTNNVATMMLADTINAWHTASLESDVISSMGNTADIAYAKQLETSVDQDVFLSLLARHTNSGGAVSSFLGKTLFKAVPGITSPQVMKLITSSSGDVRWSETGASDAYGARTLEALAALNIQAMLPSIMVESLLGTVVFTVTNANARGQDVFGAVGHAQSSDLKWTRSAIQSFAPEAGEKAWEIFRLRFERDLLPYLRQAGKAFQLTVSCTFYHEIDIYLKMDNEVRFVSPAFCNALAAPVQHTSTQRADVFSRSMETLVTNINEALMEAEVVRAKRGNDSVAHMMPSGPSQAFPAPPVVNTPLNLDPAPYQQPYSQPAVPRGSMYAGLSNAPAAPVAPPMAPPARPGGMRSGL